MKFSLIICTYQRSIALLNLLNSIQEQVLYPNEILIIDGSTDNETEIVLKEKSFENLYYYKVSSHDRGLTKQRNYGISKLADDCEIVCFLDDDTLLETTYFENLIKTYVNYPNAKGVGGAIINEITWKTYNALNGGRKYYCIDGYRRKEGLRFSVRKFLKLIDKTPPGYMPVYSHGRSVSYLPPSNKTYPIEYFIGCSMSFKKEVVDTIKFSTYFEGYGLYEDLDFCLRVSKLGKLYVNTAAKLEHHHNEAGRPNKYNYGKMVVRNGWYVWRVKYPKPSLKARFKWNAIVWLLILIRFGNVITTSKRKEAFTEAFGRLVGWFSLFLNEPRIEL